MAVFSAKTIAFPYICRLLLICRLALLVAAVLLFDPLVQLHLDTLFILVWRLDVANPFEKTIYLPTSKLLRCLCLFCCLL